MTEPEIEESWPLIVREARRALQRYGAQGAAWEPDEVACVVGAALMHYADPPLKLIRQIARNAAVSHIRFSTNARKRAGKHLSSTVPLRTLHLQALEVPPARASCDFSGLLSRGLVMATKRQRRTVQVVVACGGDYSVAARRLRVSRHAVSSCLQSFRRRCRRLCELTRQT